MQAQPEPESHAHLKDWGLGNAELEERMGFVKKVFGILAFQLALTAGLVIWFTLDA